MQTLDLFDQQQNRFSGRVKIVIAIGMKTRAPGAKLLDLALVQPIAQGRPPPAASSSHAFTLSTSSRRFSIASKRVRYSLTSRAMMSKSVNSQPRNGSQCTRSIQQGLAPQSNSVALGSSPRARRALVVCGLWAGTECRASGHILRRLERENG